jgi:tetratricopeptide (TPR) repeat protein
LGFALTAAGRYDESIEILRRAIELNPAFAVAHRGLAAALEAQGRYAEAVTHLQEVLPRFGDEPMILGTLGRLHGIAGQRDEAQSVLRELEQQSTRRYVPPIDRALIYLGLGETEQAFEWLEHSYDDRSFWFIYSIRFPLFAGIRSDSRFEDLLRRMKLQP